MRTRRIVPVILLLSGLSSMQGCASWQMADDEEPEYIKILPACPDAAKADSLEEKTRTYRRYRIAVNDAGAQIGLLRCDWQKLPSFFAGCGEEQISREFEDKLKEILITDFFGAPLQAAGEADKEVRIKEWELPLSFFKDIPRKIREGQKDQLRSIAQRYNESLCRRLALGNAPGIETGGRKGLPLASRMYSGQMNREQAKLMYHEYRVKWIDGRFLIGGNIYDPDEAVAFIKNDGAVEQAGSIERGGLTRWVGKVTSVVGVIGLLGTIVWYSGTGPAEGQTLVGCLSLVACGGGSIAVFLGTDQVCVGISDFNRGVRKRFGLTIEY